MDTLDYILNQENSGRQRAALAQFAQNHFGADSPYVALAQYPEAFASILPTLLDPAKQMAANKEKAIMQYAMGTQPQDGNSYAGGDSSASAPVPQSLPQQGSALAQIAPSQPQGLSPQQRALAMLIDPSTIIKSDLEQSSPEGIMKRQKDALELQGMQQKQVKAYDQIQQSYDDANEQFDNTKKTIDRVLPRVSNWTAGAGSTLSYVPGTPSKDVEADLTSIKSGVMLDQLKQLKEMSANGGSGMGALSDSEGRILASRIANVEQAQSPEQLKSNLTLLKDSIASSQERLKAAHAQDQKMLAGGTFGQMQANPASALSQMAPPKIYVNPTTGQRGQVVNGKFQLIQ